MVTGLLLTALVLTDPILTDVSFLSIVKSETKIKYKVNQAFFLFLNPNICCRYLKEPSQ